MKKVSIFLLALIFPASFLNSQDSVNSVSYQLYLTQIAAAEAFFQLNKISTAREYLDACDPGYRDLEWQFLDACLDQSDTSISFAGSPTLSDIKMSPDGDMIAVCGSDSLVTLLSYPGLEPVLQLRGHRGQVSTVCFNGDGTGLFSGGRDHAVILWRTASGQMVWKNDSTFSKGIYQVRFDRNVNMLGVATWESDPSRDPQVVGFTGILDARTGHSVKKIENDAHPSAGIVFTERGKNIIVSTWGEAAYCYDALSGQELWRYDLSDPEEYNAFHSIALSPDSHTLLLGSADHRIHVLNTSDGRLVHRIEPYQGHTKTIKALAFSPDGSRFASAGEDQTILVWNAETFQKISALSGHTKTVTALCWAEDGQSMLSVSLDGTLKAWDLQHGFTWSYEICDYGPWQTPLSPDKQYFAAPCSDEKLFIYEASTGKPLTFFGTQKSLCADISNDGKQLVTAGFDGIVRLWDIASGTELMIYNSHSARVDGVVHLSSADLIASAGDTTLMIWHAPSGKAIHRIPVTDRPFRVVKTPGEEKIFTGCGNGTIKGYRASDWTETDHFVAERGLQEMAVSPDGKLMAVFSGKNIEIFDLATRERRFFLDGHEQSGYGLDFSPDSRYLVSGSYDQTFKLWNLGTGQCTLTFHGFEETIYSTKFLGGNEIFLGTSQGMMHYYHFSR
ncbi:MAG: WD40 repeat domain-containing protein [Bacteroidales bacterium]|jgi:WD40 repeat protein|nr:WD40 repeat domain-containing protein [Bacteroidales bacterium]